MEFAEEKLSECLEEVKQLIYFHNEETAPFEGMEVNPNWDAFKRIEAAGKYAFFTFRVGGKMVGYAGFTISHSLEYQDHLVASMNNIFVRSEFRGPGSAGFMKFSEKAVEDKGVSVIYMHTKAKKDLSRLFSAMGYESINVVFGKKIGGPHVR